MDSNKTSNVLGVLHKVAVFTAIAVILLATANYSASSKKPLVYEEHLGDVAATIDGEELTLDDIAFYVVYEEKQIEEQALIYNADSTKDYWNLHIDGVFIAADAKKAAIGMAIHDYIFYKKAVEMGMELDAEEEIYLENRIEDFWMDLFDEQLERMPTTEDKINSSIYKMALAQKYQEYIALENGRLFHEYDWDGYDYTKLEEAEHKVKINKKVWNKVKLGDITLNHESVSYINGLTDAERQEIINNKK